MFPTEKDNQEIASQSPPKPPPIKVIKDTSTGGGMVLIAIVMAIIFVSFMGHIK